MTSLEKPHTIDYGQRGDLRPIQTAIQVEELKNATRFTDPPNPRNVYYSLVAASLAFVAALGCAVLAIFFHADSAHRCAAGLVSVLFLYGAAGTVRIATRFAKLPTIIEVGADQFVITVLQKTYSYPSEQVGRIAFDGIPFLPDSKWFNSLKIRIGDKRHVILVARPRAEIEWFADQLRARLAKHKHSFPRVAAVSYSGTYRNRAGKFRAPPGADPAQYVEATTNTVLVFRQVDFGPGANAVVVRISSKSGGQIEFRVGTHSGKAFAIVNVPPGDDSWRTLTGQINQNQCRKASQRAYVTVCGNGSPMRIEYFQLRAESTSPEESSSKVKT